MFQSQPSNAPIVQNWINANLGAANTSQIFWVENHLAAMNEGNPLKENRDCLGVNLKTGQVSNQRYDLTLEERDEQDGL